MFASWSDKVIHSRPTMKSDGNAGSHNVRWLGLTQRSEVTFEETQ
jgi:hypothetical protein